MSNYSDRLGLMHFKLSTSSKMAIRDGLIKIFDADSDYTENEEYFRKTTLKMGYPNEAHRVVAEYMNRNTSIDDLKSVTKAVNKMADKIFKNYVYYADYEVSVYKISRDEFSVSVAFTY